MTTVLDFGDPFREHAGPHLWKYPVVSSFTSPDEEERICDLCGRYERSMTGFMEMRSFEPPRIVQPGYKPMIGFDPATGVVTYSSAPVGQGRGSDGHEHVWAYHRETRRVTSGIIDLDVRVCEVPGCGKQETKTHAENYFTREERDETLQLRADPLRRVTLMADGTEIQVAGEPVMQYGGIVAYDQTRDQVQFGDGGQADLEVLIQANPSVPPSLLVERLKNLPSEFFSPQSLALRLTQLADREQKQRQQDEQQQSFMNAMAEASPQVQQAFTQLKDRMEKMGESIQTFSNELSSLMDTDDALTLILETIRNAGTPAETRELASAWLTRITTEISKITRELDREEE